MTMAVASEIDTKVYIGDAAVLLNRRRATIRGWEREQMLPQELRSYRDTRGWRYWTPDQIIGIKRWIIEADMRPGKAFEHYKPTPEQIAAHIAKCRGARKPRLVDDPDLDLSDE